MCILYDEWLAANENWKSSSYVAALKQRKSHQKIGARRWMTFRQIQAKYDGDEQLAKAIVENKLNDPVLRESSVKPHPDLPDNPVSWLGSEGGLGRAVHVG